MAPTKESKTNPKRISTSDMPSTACQWNWKNWVSLFVF